MKTQSFNSASSNLGATIKQSARMIMGKDVSNFTLVFLDPTTTQAANSSQMFVVPNITIGRGSACHVRYADQYSSVSRQHASITGNNGQYYLNHNPAATNPTFVNGTPINGTHLLQNGDTIQFSQNGPSARFNTSGVKTSTMGVTARVNRAMGQAVRPYRKALALISLLLVGSIGALSYNFVDDDKTKKDVVETKEDVKANEEKISMTSEELTKLDITLSKSNDLISNLGEELDEAQDSLFSMKTKSNELEEKLEKASKNAGYSASQIKLLRNQLKDSEKKKDEILLEVGSINKQINREATKKNKTINEAVKQNVTSTIDRLHFDDLPTDDVYHVYAIRHEISHADFGAVIVEEVNDYLYTGTAFLTNENILITARHVVQPYRFSDGGKLDPKSLFHNVIEANSGRIITTFKAVSKNGDEFTFNTKNVEYDDSNDKTEPFPNIRKEELLKANYPQNVFDWSTDKSIKRAPLYGNRKDWAYIPIRSRKGSIKLNRELSKDLKWGTKLYVVGYTHGDYLQTKKDDSLIVLPTDLSPLLTETMVAQNGLINREIHTSIVGFGPGNSGGPVFVKTPNGFEAVGIVSYGVGSQIGVITPVSQMR